MGRGMKKKVNDKKKRLILAQKDVRVRFSSEIIRDQIDNSRTESHIDIAK